MWEFLLLLLLRLLFCPFSEFLFHIHQTKKSSSFLTGTIMSLNVSEQRVIQSLAVCPALGPIFWHAWMQSVASPIYGTTEDIETFLE